MIKAIAILALTTSTAAAEARFAGGYLMSQATVDSLTGADHALAVHYEHLVGSDVDVGVAVHGGHTFGRGDESLTRVAILPTVGLRGRIEGIGVRGDIALGWQALSGQANLGGIPVSGTEARGLRLEFGLALEGEITKQVSLRARFGLAMNGVYPLGLPSERNVGPLVELALVFAR